MIYRALDRLTQRQVALKTLRRATPSDVLWLKEEFRTLSLLRHPGLVRIHDLVVDDDTCLFTMDVVEGVSFAEYAQCAQDGEARWRRVRDTGARLLDVLSVIHGSDVVHRDIKPSNVLVSGSGAVTLLDFGLALRTHGLAKAEAASAAGTLPYMAPEVALGAAATPASDVYSTGALLFEALTGRLPFEGDANEIIGAKYAELPALSAPEVPPDAAEAILASLDPDPRERPTVGALARALGATTSERRRSGLVLVGREADVAVLDAAVEASRDGRARYVEIRGPSGIGKTFLVEQTLSRWRAARRAVVLTGKCLARAHVPFPGLDGLVDDLTREAETRAYSPAVSDEQRRALLTLFPVLGRLAAFRRFDAQRDTLDPREQRRLAFDGFVALLEELARELPLVLFVDDAHWLDADSVAFFEALTVRPRACPLVVVLSVRSPESDASPPLSRLRTAAHDHGLDVITRDVGPLDPSSLEALVAAVSGAPLGAERVTSVVEEAAGSPLLAVQLARDVSDAASGSPSDVASLVERRATRLSVGARALLTAVCLSYVPLTLDVAARAARVDEPLARVAELLDEGYLVREAPLAQAMPVWPYHDRVRDAVVRAIPEGDLAERHRSLAATLGIGDVATAAARVWHLRDSGALTQAARDAVVAADGAAARLAFDLAADLYRFALGVQDAGLSRPHEIAERLANVAVASGRLGDAADAFERAAALLGRASPGDERVQTLRNRAAEFLLRSGQIAEGTASLDRCLARAGVQRPSSDGSLIASIAWQRLQVDWRRPDATPRSGDLDTRRRAELEACWTAMIGLVWVDVVLGTHFQLRHSLIALDSADVVQRVRAMSTQGSYLATDSTPARARRSRRFIEAAREVASRSGDPGLLAFVHGCDAAASYLRTEVRRSIACADAADEAVLRGWRSADWSAADSHIMRVNAVASLGDMETMRRYFPETRLQAQHYGDVRLASVARVRDLTPLALDDPDAIERFAKDGLEPWKLATRSMTPSWSLLTTTQSALYSGDVSRARRLVSEHRRHLRRSLLSRVRLLRIHLRFSAGSVALAEALRCPGRSSRLAALAEAHLLGRLLLLDGGDFGCGFGQALLGAAAAIRGDAARSAGWLSRARRTSEANGTWLLGRAIDEARAKLTGAGRPDWPPWIGDPRRLSWSTLPFPDG